MLTWALVKMGTWASVNVPKAIRSKHVAGGLLLDPLVRVAQAAAAPTQPQTHPATWLQLRAWHVPAGPMATQ
jgi:hypothetical protein